MMNANPARPRPVGFAAALLFCYCAVAPAYGGATAREFGSARAPADNCARRTAYVRAERRDTLAAYAALLQTAGRRTALTAGGRKYGETTELVSTRGWALRHDVRFDGDTYSLARPDALERRSARGAPQLPGGGQSPHTERGIALGDPLAKVGRLYGAAKPTSPCGRPELAFAGPGQYGDWFAIYRAGTRGEVVSVRTGDVANGTRHLWQ